MADNKNQKQNSKQTTINDIKAYITETAKIQKPETTSQLIKLVQPKYSWLHDKEIVRLLIQLENEDKLTFPKKEKPLPPTINGYIFSKRAYWYWTTIAIATTIAVFTITEEAYPIVYIRSILGILFVLFLPGYALVKALFPTNVPIKTSSENMDTIERAALNLGMSLALTPTVGLILNYTPWGIRLTPVTLSLLALTVAFATAAILREYQTKTTKTI